MSTHYYLITEEQHFQLDQCRHVLNLVGNLAYEATATTAITPQALAALTGLIEPHLAVLEHAPCQQIALVAPHV